MALGNRETAQNGSKRLKRALNESKLEDAAVMCFLMKASWLTWAKKNQTHKNWLYIPNRLVENSADDQKQLKG